MNNKQTTKCTECFKEITTENYSGDNCNSCTGTTETKFSDFIKNSTEEEATEVFTDIMKGVSEDQKVILETTLEDRFDKEFLVNYSTSKGSFFHKKVTPFFLENKIVTPLSIKYFIKQELQQVRERCVEIIKNTMWKQDIIKAINQEL